MARHSNACALTLLVLGFLAAGSQAQTYTSVLEGSNQVGDPVGKDARWGLARSGATSSAFQPACSAIAHGLLTCSAPPALLHQQPQAVAARRRSSCACNSSTPRLHPVVPRSSDRRGGQRRHRHL